MNGWGKSGKISWIKARIIFSGILPVAISGSDFPNISVAQANMKIGQDFLNIQYDSPLTSNGEGGGGKCAHGIFNSFLSLNSGKWFFIRILYSPDKNPLNASDHNSACI